MSDLSITTPLESTLSGSLPSQAMEHPTLRSVVTELENRYFVIRHPRAVTNEDGVLNSGNIDGKYLGPTKDGLRAFEESFRSLITTLNLADLSQSLIISSELERCKLAAFSGAQLFAQYPIDSPQVFLRSELNDRSYGLFEGQSVDNWEHLRRGDILDPSIRKFEAESVFEMKERIINLIADLERAHTGKIIFLLTHADLAQIIADVSRDTPAVHYSRNRELKNGESFELGQLK